jgi:hypothetical protein
MLARPAPLHSSPTRLEHLHLAEQDAVCMLQNIGDLGAVKREGAHPCCSGGADSVLGPFRARLLGPPLAGTHSTVACWGCVRVCGCANHQTLVFLGLHLKNTPLARCESRTLWGAHAYIGLSGPAARVFVPPAALSAFL